MGTLRITSFSCCNLLLLFLLAPFCSSRVSVETVDVHATKYLIASQRHVYLDVRTSEEFYDGHVKDAINIPYLFFTTQGKVKNPKFLEQVSAIYDTDDLIVVGCLCGVRSLEASEALINAGFKNVKNIGGGYEAWVKNGFAVVNRPRSEL